MLSIIKTRLVFLIIASGLAFMTQGCAKKKFTALGANDVNVNTTGTGTGTGSTGSTIGGTGGSGSTTGSTGSTIGGTGGSGSTTGSTGSTTGGTGGSGSTTGSTGSTIGGTGGSGSTTGSTGSTIGGTGGSGSTTGGTTTGSTGGTGSTTGGTTTGGTGGSGSTTGGSTTGGTGGCAPFDPGCNFTPKFCVTEKFRQPPVQITRKLDVWIITDSSASMDDERAAVANGITNYLSQLPSNVDARFAVSLAHGTTSWFAGRLTKSDFKDPNEKYVISNKQYSSSQISYWMDRKLRYRQKDYSVRAWDNSGNKISGQALKGLPTDFDADGGEAGLISMYEATKSARHSALQNLSTEIPGDLNFFRKDAALAVIFISDENDICTANGVYDPDKLEIPYRAKYCAGRTPAKVLAQLRARRQSLPLYVSSVIYTGQGAIPTGLENSIGHGYNYLTSLANGTLIDIAAGTANIPMQLANIGALTSTRLNLKYDFELSHENVLVNDSKYPLEILVDGSSVSGNYISGTNTVHLDYPGRAQSRVQIRYCVEGESLVTHPIGVSSYLLNTVPQTYKPEITIEEN